MQYPLHHLTSVASNELPQLCFYEIVPCSGDFARAGMFNVSSLVYSTGPVYADSFGSLPCNLAFDLSYNNLSGPIPDFLTITKVPLLLQRGLNLSVSHPHPYATCIACMLLNN